MVGDPGLFHSVAPRPYPVRVHLFLTDQVHAIVGARSPSSKRVGERRASTLRAPMGQRHRSSGYGRTQGDAPTPVPNVSPGGI
jgi:hypothetical protein